MCLGWVKLAHLKKLGTRGMPRERRGEGEPQLLCCLNPLIPPELKLDRGATAVPYQHIQSLHTQAYADKNAHARTHSYTQTGVCTHSRIQAHAQSQTHTHTLYDRHIGHCPGRVGWSCVRVGNKGT